MYVQRLQLSNYGPIENLDLSFPIDGDHPMPIVLVGSNGSGKSILLSHIVNGLIAAKQIAYPDSLEVAEDKVYKLRSSSYIYREQHYYFARVDFENDWSISEMRTRLQKEKYEDPPEGIMQSSAEALWKEMEPHDNDRFSSSITFPTPADIARLTKAFTDNCVLYFPSSRFEEPAWLNQDHLTAEAEHLTYEKSKGHTTRKIIVNSPLHENQNWLFELIYDRSVAELRTSNRIVATNEASGPTVLQIFEGYSGPATRIFNAVNQLVRSITGIHDASVRVGPRQNRAIVVQSESAQLSQNLFHLSSGEISMLNIVLSILRDYDLSGSQFGRVSDVRGIVVIDEVDLNLHARGQHETLPRLLKSFPRVQFVVATHSPLFVLGMEREYGQSGFALYHLPEAAAIGPENFREFGNAYRAFRETRVFATEIREAIASASTPVLIVEGSTDIDYIQRAATLLEKTESLSRVRLMDGGGHGKMDSLWKALSEPMSEVLPQQVLLLYDCDKNRQPESRGVLFRRTLPQQNNPIAGGIENLFARPTLERAIQHKPAFVDIQESHKIRKRGEPKTIPEVWTVNHNEKRNLCDWICENGNADDFRAFDEVFRLVDEVTGQV